MMKNTLFLVFLFLMFFAPVGAFAVSSQETFVSLTKEANIDLASQSVCIENNKGNSLFSHNADASIIPASVSKLYLFDWAISELPIDFRYTTDFYLSGRTLYINGGGDPHFVIGYLRNIIAKIYQEKKVLINTFVFSPDFYFNWQSSPKDVQMSLFKSLKEGAGAPIAPKIRVIIGEGRYPGAGDKYQFQSAPLPALIKQINDYSTNSSADSLFHRLGGSSGFAIYMKKTYGVDSKYIVFRTGSGLSGNYTTCNLTLRVLRHLDEQISKNNLLLTDIMSVPTVDPGVLNKRLIDKEYAQSVVAKSGFVNYHHSLAGIINTKKGSIYFAIFTDFDDMKKSGPARAMIDRFLNDTLERNKKILKSFHYIPDFTLIKAFRISRE